MGIPSYFKRLIDTYTHLIFGTLDSAAHLHLDLNCAIYGCVHKLQKRHPYNPVTRDDWEMRLCHDVIEYITTITNFVKPSTTLHIAIDGVVHMAKMKQQRQRRFKSAFIRQLVESYDSTPKWDTNAITPGTAFMAKLSTAITTALPTFGELVPTVIFSDSEEPGEGEHKIMNYIRNTAVDSGYHIVYGLDADLIMLSLLQVADGHRVALVREAVEFGKIKYDADNRETLIFFDIMRLAEIIQADIAPPTAEPGTLHDYVALCTMLGNDFVPHGLSLTIQDDGIERIMGVYKDAREFIGKPLVTADGTFDAEMLTQIFVELAAKEQEWLAKWRRSRQHVRPQFIPHGLSDTEKMLAELENWPISQMTTELGWKLDEPAYYYAEFVHYDDVNKLCDMYVESLVWVLNYYLGRNVNAAFYYPWHLPPLWASLAERPVTCEQLARCNARSLQHVEQITSAQQSAMVFPIASYHLVSPAYHHVPREYPEYFPAEYGFYVIGKKFFWQCEPIIPLIPYGMLGKN